MAGSSDYIVVNQPHNPYSISGSDPYHMPGQEASGSARLSVWYTFDRGYVQTGSQTDGAGPNDNFLYAVYDRSGNSRDRSSVERHLRMTDNARPTLSSSATDSQTLHRYRHPGDDQFFIQGNTDSDEQDIHLSNNTLNFDSNSTHTYSNYWNSSWVSQSSNVSQHNAAGTQGHASHHDGGRTLFVTARIKSYENHYYSRILFNYGSKGYQHSNDSANFSSFGLGLTALYRGYEEHNTIYSSPTIQYNKIDNGDQSFYTATDTDTGIEHSNQSDSKEGSWCPVAMKWFSGSSEQVLRMYTAGKMIQDYYYQWKSSADNPGTGVTWFPNFNGGSPTVSIGGNGVDGGGGGGVETTNRIDGYGTGISECFAFDDALSEVRMAQMGQYQSDRLQTQYSGSHQGRGHPLSLFDGGGKGAVAAHAIGNLTTNAIASGQGSEYCRAYYQELTASGVRPFHHETAGGLFLNSTSSTGGFHRVPSTKAISLRAWVRAEGTDDSIHAGSQCALIVKGESPFGHQTDHIKGYALKFGTLVDGADTGDVPKFVLSLRNANIFTDGTTAGSGSNTSCSDLVVTSSTFTTAKDKWYQVRLDVVPAGTLYDQVKAYARESASDSWVQLGSATGDNTKIIYNDDPNYRYWVDDTEFSEGRHWIQTGVHNGYYVSMSSSTGHRISTKYYIDKFEAKLDTVA